MSFEVTQTEHSILILLGTSDLKSLQLSFLICNVGIKKPTLESCVRIQWSDCCVLLTSA